MQHLPWRPIAELYKDGQYDHDNDSEAGFMLLAPELVDLDCNVHGVGLGYFQDDGKLWNATDEEIIRMQTNREDEGSWMACKWSMTNDEWAHVCCNPTHYIKLKGVS